MSALTTSCWKQVSVLTKNFAPRPVGSAANHRAEEYIRYQFKHFGLQVSRYPFECPLWQADFVSLKFKGQSIPAWANSFSPAGVVSGPVKLLYHLEELEQADLSYCIAVLCGELTKEAWVNVSNPFYAPEEHRRLIHLLNAKQPVGVITISNEPTYPLSILEEWSLTMPNVNVTQAAGLELLQLGAGVADLEVQTQSGKGETAHVVGLKPAGETAARLIIGAHYDTKHGTAGAFDNGSGVAVMLALAEHLSAKSWPITLEFVAFSGEEYGLGSNAYLNRFGEELIPPDKVWQPRPSLLDDILVAINIDGVGQSLATNTVATFGVSSALAQCVEQVRHKHHRLAPAEAWPASNHYDFVSHQVPTVAFSSAGGAHLLHRPNDTLHWLSPAQLADVAQMIAELVVEIADKSPAWASATSG